MGVKAGTLEGRSVAAARLADFVELTKPRISFMVVVTAAAGFFLAAEADVSLLRLSWALLGTALLASGASALNQVLERRLDARMRRTAQRPVPTGRVDVDVALAFGVTLVVLGVVELVLIVNLLTAFLGAATVAGYAFVYTPLKRVTSLATVVGAVPGAIPPMMGWAAERDALGAGAWALFGILFFWQLPHFLAIAWMYRADYARGGLPMLTVLDRDGRRTARQMILWGAALVPVSLQPTVLGLTGTVYFVGALVLGLAYLGGCFDFARLRTVPAARRLLLFSVFYLPGLLAVMLIDRLLS